VNLRGGTRAAEYLTDDLQEAFEHGRALAASRDAATAPENRPEIIHRKWRKPTSARAQRRRMIKAHNHRMCARMLKSRAKKDAGDFGNRRLARRCVDDEALR
jgi:hypothetical protein